MSKILHLRCGTDIRDALQIAQVPGEFREWGDPICQGPAPGKLELDTYRQLRADFMHRHWDIEPGQTLARLQQDAQTLRDLAYFDEILLWFEHDLYDQCILIQLLSQIPASTLARCRLISTDRFSGIDRFIGLGQLNPTQLASLLPSARPVQAEDQAIAQRVLRAFQGSSPTELETYLDPGSCGPLQYLPAAIKRHLQELPWVDVGLGLTDTLALAAVNQGKSLAVEVFQHAQLADWQPHLGDLMFWAHLDALASGPLPLLTMQGEFPVQQLTLTPRAKELLASLPSDSAFAQSRAPSGCQSVQVSHSREPVQYIQSVPAHPRLPMHAGALGRWVGGIEQDPDRGWIWGWDERNGRAQRLACG